MRTAIIAPTRLLSRYATTGYHLVLAHRAAVDADYLKFYTIRRRDYCDFVILDNAAHEYGEARVDVMESMIDAIRPSEVVLPDRLFQAHDTVELTKSFLGWCRNRYGQQLPFSTMAVPQGTTWDEWVDCCSRLLGLGVSTIGISKDYESWAGGYGLVALVAVVRALALREPLDSIHLLGWGRRLRQLKDLAAMSAISYPKIRGVDSGKPLVYSAMHLDLADLLSRTDHTAADYPRRPGGFFDWDDGDVPEPLADDNIREFRRLARDLPATE